MLPCEHLSIGIDCPYDQAYAFLAAPENMAQWAEGLGSALRCERGQWIAQTPAGPARVRFTPPNELGVLDHWVSLPSGATIYVPMRVVASGEGCETTLTLFRHEDMTDEKFHEDAAWVRRDPRRLKENLEAKAGRAAAGR